MAASIDEKYEAGVRQSGELVFVPEQEPRGGLQYGLCLLVWHTSRALRHWLPLPLCLARKT